MDYFIVLRANEFIIFVILGSFRPDLDISTDVLESLTLESHIRVLEAIELPVSKAFLCRLLRLLHRTTLMKRAFELDSAA